tara:strand:- start:9 stop:518 length:510 start_codon:yes stop_codon:yes gene_type:complete
MFEKMKSSGAQGKNAEKLYNKYAGHFKEQHSIILMDEIDDLAETYEEYGLGKEDYDWVRIYIRLQTGFKYPSADILWAVYKDWYTTTKNGKSAELKLITWNKMFNEAAVKYDKRNKGKEYTPQYLRKKMANLIMSASKKSGKTLPNPVSVGGSRVSVEQVMNADDLDWI